MSNFSYLWNTPAVQAGCAQLATSVEATLEEAIAIQQVAAPTFAERERARLMVQRFEALGLNDVEMDAEGNVYGRLPGREAGAGVLVSAHLDTVFPAQTDLTVQRKGNRVYGPGIGDNSMGTAGLLRLAMVLSEHTPRRDVWFVANVCEEGLGNLKGMWTVVRRLQPKIGAVVVLEGGMYGSVIHKAIGVHRRRLTVTTDGGHSWSDFGTPSAIHELCRIGAVLAGMKVSKKPRTSYNLGVIEGGTSINTIAATATALLDLRSEEPKGLRQLTDKVDRILLQARRKGVDVRSEVIGERPAGVISLKHPLVQAALASLKWVGHDDPQPRMGSTDANVPLSMGIPAVCIGITVGKNPHRLDEYIELAPLKEGLQHCYLTILVALEYV